MNLLLLFFILFDMFTSLYVMDKYHKIKQKLKAKNEEIDILKSFNNLLQKENEILESSFEKLCNCVSDSISIHLERTEKQ